jgi:hypothetical protein
MRLIVRTYGRSPRARWGFASSKSRASNRKTQLVFDPLQDPKYCQFWFFPPPSLKRSGCLAFRESTRLKAVVAIVLRGLASHLSNFPPPPLTPLNTILSRVGHSSFSIYICPSPSVNVYHSSLRTSKKDRPHLRWPGCIPSTRYLCLLRQAFLPPHSPQCLSPRDIFGTWCSPSW